MADSGMSMGVDSFIEMLQLHDSSGTDADPNSTPVHMLGTEWHGWQWMLHGEAFLNDIQQSGPRGADKLFSTNWLMSMAQRRQGKGLLTLRAMLSLEPATVSSRRYPESLPAGRNRFWEAHRRRAAPP